LDLGILRKEIELSLNEYETLLNKAAVGSGLPWGVAEDAAACGAWFMSFGVNELDTWIAYLNDNLFWIDYCRKIDQPKSNKLNNIFDLAASVYVNPDTVIKFNSYEWNIQGLIIDGVKQIPSYRACLSEKQFKILNEYAYKTYAPATDESRLSGAGAGLSDND
jgi:hypothetical protein